jgi:hypothetical protein
LTASLPLTRQIDTKTKAQIVKKLWVYLQAAAAQLQTGMGNNDSSSEVVPPPCFDISFF